jgi:DtxR family Mn-dependent transcriptional regulator
VSERLIERIDAMLGRPAVDPHGDPIPSAEGFVAPTDGVDLTTAPIGARVRVTRVIDQEADFLRFVERCDLTPGRAVVVTSRDLAADAVHITTEDGRGITIGTRAAGKVLVQA